MVGHQCRQDEHLRRRSNAVRVHVLDEGRPAHCYKIDLGPGTTPARDGYYVGGYGCTRNSMDPMTLYGYEPFFESADAIESRHTRRVPCTSPEISYSGGWTDEANDQYYERGEDPHQEKMAKVSETANSSVQFSFKGADIYWRALKAANCGKADVYVDNRRQRDGGLLCRICHALSVCVYQDGPRPERNAHDQGRRSRRQELPLERNGRQAYPVRVCGGKLPRLGWVLQRPGKKPVV